MVVPVVVACRSDGSGTQHGRRQAIGHSAGSTRWCLGRGLWAGRGLWVGRGPRCGSASVGWSSSAMGHITSVTPVMFPCQCHWWQVWGHCHCGGAIIAGVLSLQGCYHRGGAVIAGVLSSQECCHCRGAVIAVSWMMIPGLHASWMRCHRQGCGKGVGSMD